jgi:predicted peroxiredoxin
MKTRFILSLAGLLFIIANHSYAQEIIDLSGIKISNYVVLKISENLQKIRLNESVKIKTDNYKAVKQDLEAWSRISGNRVNIIENKENSLIYQIDKQVETRSNGKKYSIIISDNELGSLISPLGLSVCAALSGYQVNIYFQGPAVRVLKKGFKEKLKGFNVIFSGFARNGLAKIGNPPAQEKLKILEKLGAKFYVCQPSMNRYKVKETDIVFPNIVICEYYTFIEVMNNSELKFFLQ